MLIAARASRSATLPWSAQWIMRPESLGCHPGSCGAETWSKPLQCPTAPRSASSSIPVTSSRIWSRSCVFLAPKSSNCAELQARPRASFEVLDARRTSRTRPAMRKSMPHCMCWRTAMWLFASGLNPMDRATKPPMRKSSRSGWACALRSGSRTSTRSSSWASRTRR